MPQKTGEEDERTVWEGEGALFEFAGGGWKERGKGQMKVNVSNPSVAAPGERSLLKPASYQCHVVEGWHAGTDHIRQATARLAGRQQMSPFASVDLPVTTYDEHLLSYSHMVSPVHSCLDQMYLWHGPAGEGDEAGRRHARLVMRRRQDLRLLLNASLWPAMALTPMDGGKVGSQSGGAMLRGRLTAM